MRNIVCIGGSTGALDALQRLLRGLPADFPAAVFVVRHVAANSGAWLADILTPLCALPVAIAEEGAAIESGRVLIGPADRHLVLDRKTVHLIDGPKENWARPAIDPLFRSAAHYHAPRTVGVLLSGKLDDGVAGLWALKRRGGFVVVQTPGDALADDMPKHALAAMEPDAVADAEEIGKLLPQWLATPSAAAAGGSLERQLTTENAYLTGEESGREALDELGQPAALVCPECGGQLWKLKEGPARYRCHVGHAYSAHTLLESQREVVEETGWRFLRAIEEERTLIEQLPSEGVSEIKREELHARAEKLRALLADVGRLLRPRGLDAHASDREC